MQHQAVVGSLGAVVPTSNSRRSIEREVGANPVDLLARAPQNYLGPLFMPPAEMVPPQSWYFDQASAELVYRPGRTRYLTEPADAASGLRFHIVLSEPAPRRSDGVPELRQAVIQPRRPYRWVID